MAPSRADQIDNVASHIAYFIIINNKRLGIYISINFSKIRFNSRRKNVSKCNNYDTTRNIIVYINKYCRQNMTGAYTVVIQI